MKKAIFLGFLIILTTALFAQDVDWQKDRLYLGPYLGSGRITEYWTAIDESNYSEVNQLTFMGGSLLFQPFRYFSIEVDSAMTISNIIFDFMTINLFLNGSYMISQFQFNAGIGVSTLAGLCFQTTAGIRMGPGVLYLQLFYLLKGENLDEKTDISAYAINMGYRFGMWRKN